jgi:hypothetical protein
LNSTGRDLDRGLSVLMAGKEVIAMAPLLQQSKDAVVLTLHREHRLMHEMSGIIPISQDQFTRVVTP